MNDFQQGEQIWHFPYKSMRKDMWINGMSILMQICNNMDLANFLVHQSEGIDDLIR